MSHPRQPGSSHLCLHGQRGATLMIMLVIMVMGAATFLIGSLSTTALKNARQEKTAAALAQAKEALIGYAVKDSNRPGELPCPDVDGDGMLTMNVDYGPGTLCKQFTGYLPWKTLGLPELRDGTNAKLWYAISQNFYAGNTVALNSDTLGQLSVSGTISLNNIAAIVFAPGAPLCGKSHATNNVDQYLEAMSSVTAITAVVNTNSNDCNNSPYNDNLLAITADQIFQPVEKRIAREVKRCLDEYAAYPAGKYPWAASVSDTNYMGIFGTRFGRLSYQQPNTSTSPVSATLYAALSALQIAVNNYASSGSLADKTALIGAGNYVISLKNTIPAITDPVNTAGDWAVEFADGGKTQAQATSKISLANAALAPYQNSSPDLDMSSAWTPFCITLFNSSYWPDWKELVFYQIAYGYRPGATTPLNCGATCLSVTGTGNSTAGSGTYRAVVVVAGKKLGANRIPTNATDYLETENLLPQGNSAKPYTTYRPTDPAYQSVNDLALCIDGNVNCK